MRLFQATWSHPERGGDKRVSRNWSCEFRWRGNPRSCRLTLFADRKASEQVAAKIERLMAVRESGDVPDATMCRWLEQAPRRVVAYLAKLGIVDPRWTAASRTLEQHLVDFKAALLARGNTRGWVDLVAARAGKVISGCGFGQWSDVSANAVERFVAGLRKGVFDHTGRVERKGISIQTSNFHIAAIKQFANWMLQEGRASSNPVAHTRGLNTRIDRRHDRRALTVVEMRFLLSHTAAGPDRQRVSGPERAMLYRTAAETGLRAGELRSLTRASFTLAANPPTIRVEAGYSKRRREDSIPLRPDTAAALAAFLGTKAPAAGAFCMPGASNVAKMLRSDLESARTAWINAAGDPAEREEREASEFLLYRDHAGRFIDFHAFRHTYISNLVNAGVNPRTCQTLARHSTITLTMDRYSHTLRGAEQAALAALPDLSTPVAGLHKAG